MKHFIRLIKKEVKQSPFDYLLFLTVCIFFILAVGIFRGERLLEFIILLSFVTFYIIWGIYHHIIQNTVHLKIMLEYILIGFTALFLLKILILP